MRAVFNAELDAVREAAAMVYDELGLYTKISVFGYDGNVTVDYHNVEPVMLVIGRLAYTGSLEYAK